MKSNQSRWRRRRLSWELSIIIPLPVDFSTNKTRIRTHVKYYLIICVCVYVFIICTEGLAVGGHSKRTAQQNKMQNKSFCAFGKVINRAGFFSAACAQVEQNCRRSHAQSALSIILREKMGKWLNESMVSRERYLGKWSQYARRLPNGFCQQQQCWCRWC